VLPADSLCNGGFFPVCCGFFPVIHWWSFVYHSSMFRVVDVLYAASYTVAEDEWIFSSLLWIFPVCHGLHRAVVWVIHGVSCRRPVYRRIFSCHLLLGIVHQSSMFRVVDVLCADSLCIGGLFCVYYGLFSCRLLLSICASLQYVQSSWCGMCC